MLADTAKLMDEYNQIAINDLWYEGNKLCIDLDASVKQKMGSDCFSDEALKNLLARTFFSFPSVEEIELLVEGEKGYFGEKEVLTVPAEVASPDWKTAAVRYYFYRGQSFEQEYAYSEKLITYADLVQDTIKNMNEYCGIKITAIWYEGNKICVDLDESEVYKLDAGSTAGWIETYVLLETFSSYPNVKEIEILIGGQKGMSGEHFSFNEVFVVIG